MAQQPYVGSNTRALDAAAFVSGQANYTSDYFFDGQLYAHVIRSPHAAARIKNVELGDAAKVSGVVLAMDGAQAAEHLDPIVPGVRHDDGSRAADGESLRVSEFSRSISDTRLAEFECEIDSELARRKAVRVRAGCEP